MGPEADGPRLLAGGNPQIPKGDGDGPVQAYIAAMPGWKRALGERLDALVAATVPDVERAVRWNQPLYGTEPGRWFLSYRCVTSYVKVTFFRGSALDPVPPEAGKDQEARHLHVHEDDDVDEALFVAWISQAADLPGVTL